jgi:hypothetical protein
MRASSSSSPPPTADCRGVASASKERRYCALLCLARRALITGVLPAAPAAGAGTGGPRGGVERGDGRRERASEPERERSCESGIRSFWTWGVDYFFLIF